MMVLMNLSGDTSGWLHRSRTFGLAIKALLDAQVKINRIYLEQHQVPPLYRAGVRYMNEPDSWIARLAPLYDGKEIHIEEFASISEIIKRGFGDCDDLAPWRVSELQNCGENAKIRIQWKRPTPTARKLFHIVVRRGNGTIEDPSLKLGMGRLPDLL